MPAEKHSYKERAFECPKCGHKVKKLLWDYDPPPLCICEGTTEMVPECDIYRANAAPGVIGDECDVTLEHVMPGRRFTSKSELKREMAARGYENHVTHVPPRGSDKSPHTTRWT